MPATSDSFQNPARTVLPIAEPLSTAACARRTPAALMPSSQQVDAVEPTGGARRFLSDPAANFVTVTNDWRHLPAPARPIAAATDAAVAAARARDRDALAEAVSDLAALDPAQTGLILGTAVRLLLEDTHPDGLDGDDVRAVLEQCVRSAAEWQPDVDPHVVLILLAGALGVLDEDGEAPPKPDTLARHAALLLAGLLGRRPMKNYLTRALGEIERAQLND
jgi:hypothetical protein